VRWEGQRIASLPALLLDAISLSGFVEQLRPKLCEWFGCADAEIFLYDDDDASLWVHANREAAAAMDQRVRRASVTDRVWRQKAARRTVPLRGGGIAADVARQAKEKGQPVIALSENAAREKAYDANVDGHHRQLLTAAVLSADSQRTSRAGESTSIVAVIQLRDRRWRPPPPPPMRRGGASAQPDAPVTGEAAKEAAKLSAFTSLDVAWFEALRPQLCQALKTALHKELNQQVVYKARMADRRAMAIMNVTNSIAREVELDELFPCVVQAGGARRCLTAPPLSRSPFASSAACPARRR